MSDLGATIAKYKWDPPIQTKQNSTQLQIIENFKSDYFSGRVLCVAVDGNGIFFYSLSNLKCIKSFILDQTISFPVLPCYFEKEQILLVAMVQHGFPTRIATYFVNDEEPQYSSLSFSRVLMTSFIVDKEEKAPSGNFCLVCDEGKIIILDKNLNVTNQNSMDILEILNDHNILSNKRLHKRF